LSTNLQNRVEVATNSGPADWFHRGQIPVCGGAWYNKKRNMRVCKCCMKWDWVGPDGTTLEPNDTGHVQHPWFVTPNVLQIGGTPRPNSRIPTNYYLMDYSVVGQGSRPRNTIGDLQAPQTSTNTNMGGVRDTMMSWSESEHVAHRYLMSAAWGCKDVKMTQRSHTLSCGNDL